MNHVKRNVAEYFGVVLIGGLLILSLLMGNSPYLTYF